MTEQSPQHSTTQISLQFPLCPMGVPRYLGGDVMYFFEAGQFTEGLNGPRRSSSMKPPLVYVLFRIRLGSENLSQCVCVVHAPATRSYFSIHPAQRHKAECENRRLMNAPLADFWAGLSCSASFALPVWPLVPKSTTKPCLPTSPANEKKILAS